MSAGKKTTSLADQIYMTIKKAILNRELTPGMKLSEEVLASNLTGSRTPIRAALQRLAFEKLVEISPRKGAFVATPTPKEVKDVFEMRILLEQYAVEKACEMFQYSNEHIHTFNKVLQDEEDAYKNNKISEILDQILNFHIEIAKLSKNDLIVKNLAEYIFLTNIYISFFSEVNLNSPTSPQEHQDILQAIINNNPQLAKSLMQRHIQGVLERLNFNFIRHSNKELYEIFK